MKHGLIRGAFSNFHFLLLLVSMILSLPDCLHPFIYGFVLRTEEQRLASDSFSPGLLQAGNERLGFAGTPFISAVTKPRFLNQFAFNLGEAHSGCS